MSYSQSPSFQYRPVETRDLKRSPNCYFYVNGHQTTEPTKVNMSCRLRTMEAMMDELHKRVPKKWRTDCVRAVYTPNMGTRVHDKDTFIDGEYYVVAGTDKFQPINYKEIIEPSKPSRYRKSKGESEMEKIPPVIHTKAFQQVMGKAQQQGQLALGKRIYITVHKGKKDVPFVIKNNRASLNRIKEEIAKHLEYYSKMNIYELTNEGRGQLILDADDIQPANRYFIIYIDLEKQTTLKDINVLLTQNNKKDSRAFIVPNVSPRAHHFMSGSFPKVDPLPKDKARHDRSLGRNKVIPQIKSGSKKSEPISPFSNTTSQGSRKQHSKNSRQSRQVDYDEDQGGVFRAKGTDNAKGAKQVNETHDTHTERPIDQMEAEEVEEEDFPTKEKTTPIPPGTELNKKPSKDSKQDKDIKKQKNSEVKKNNKSNGNDKLYVSDIPPVVEEETKVDKVAKNAPVIKEATEDKESQVAEDTFDHYKDGATPNELKTSNVSTSKPPLSTSPHDSSKGVNTEEKVNEDQNERKRQDQWDDSFNEKDRHNDQRQSTPASRHEARVKEEQQKVEAATKVQAGVRGYQARKQVKAKKEEKKRQDNMRQEDERRQREDDDRQHEDEDRRREDEVRQRDDEERHQREKAATKIQAGFKGYQARKDVREKRQVSENAKKLKKDSDEAAVKIQSGFRGYMARKYTHKKNQNKTVDINANENKANNEKLERENKAVTTIQSGFRGYQVRKNIKAEKQQKYEKEKEESAKKIQASFKGYQTRKDIAKKIEEKKAHAEAANNVASHNRAATKIQAGFRGYTVRKQATIEKKRTHDIKQKQDEAATKIQAAARGYHTRKTHKQNHMESQLPDSAPERNDNDLNTAATKIQSAFKGYQTRKEIKSQVTCNSEISDLLVVDIDQLPESAISRLTHRKGQFSVRKDIDLISNVQIAFRAYHFRKQLKHVETKGDFSDYTFDVLSSACRGYLTRKRFKPNVIEKEQSQSFSEQLSHTQSSQEPNSYKYSSKKVDTLQASVKGYSVRKYVKSHIQARSKVTAVEGADYFATLIQALCKGYLVRNNIAIPKPLSATSVQGPSSPKSPTSKIPVKSYWEDSNIKMFSDKTLRLAATTIQATYHMYKTRSKMHAWKLELSAHAEQTPFASDEQEKAVSIIYKYFNEYARRKSRDHKTFHESVDEQVRPQSSESVSSVKSRKRDSSGRFKGGRKREGERVDSAVRCSTRLSESESIVEVDTTVSLIKSEYSNKIVSPRSSLPSSKCKSRGGEVEREGESLIEVEDDEGELSSIEKNVNAVSQLQAAFWAYRLRREISELMSGGGELIDIQKIDRAVSALRKDFRLRSAKVRRLGFEKGKLLTRNWWEDDEVETTKDCSVEVIKSAFSRYSDRKCSEGKSKSNFLYPDNENHSQQDNGNTNVSLESLMHIDVNYKKFLEREKTQKEKIRLKSVSMIALAMSDYSIRKNECKKREKEQSAIKIVNAMKEYTTRKHKISYRIEAKKMQSFSVIVSAIHGHKLRESKRDEKKKNGVSIITSAFQRLHLRKCNADTKKRNSVSILGSAFMGSKLRKDTKEAKKMKSISVIRSGFQGSKLRQDKSLTKKKQESIATIKIAFLSYKGNSNEREPIVLMEERLEDKFVTTEDANMKTNTEVNVMPEEIQTESKNAEAVKTIQAAFTTNAKTKQIQSERAKALRALNAKEESRRAQEAKNKESMKQIIAAFQGYTIRKQAKRLQRKSAKSHHSNISLHVEMHSNILKNRATELQAAFAGYLVRRVFLSLSKLVEANSNSSATRLSQPLERMGSLSETDDFKLRHKSIAKLQAFNEQHEFKSKWERSQMSNSPSSNQAKMPLIPYLGLSPSGMTRSKTGIIVTAARMNQLGSKSYTQPELFQPKALLRTTTKIETFIKQKMASSCIQSSFRGYLTRKDFGKKASLKKMKEKPKSSKSSRVSFTLTPQEEQKVKKQEEVSQLVRKRTSSVKLEAERRKLIAGALKLKKETHEAKQATTSVKILAEKLKEEKAVCQKSAVCIQKTYRGYKVRKALKDDRLQKYETEYEDWKYKRINAAIAIQSSWRGYTVRKDLKENEEKLLDEVPPKSTDSESSSKTESPSELPELIIINIGRTKSEIERAEQRYKNADMIQMVVRASKMRRKMKIRLARRRLTNSVAASKIQALYRGFVTRRMVKINASATRLQIAMRAYWAREKRYAILKGKEIQKQKAAAFLQAAYFGWKKRVEVEAANELHRQNEAATSVKAGFNGFVVREEMCERKKVLERVAADRLQACVRGQKERLRAFEKKMASSLIISAYRSYIQRIKMRLYKEKLEREKNAANILQASCRAYVTKKAFTKYRIQRARDHKVANQLHGAIRAKNCRDAFVKYQIELARKRTESALKIQSTYRGHIGRKIGRDRRHAKQMNDDAKYIIDLLFDRAFEYMAKRADSADRIHATVSGHQTRQRVTTKLRLMADKRYKEKYTNASTIQAMYRVKQGRIRNHKRRALSARNAAATKVQACYRGRQTREHYRQRQVLAAKKCSASLVQTVFRCQQARNRLKAAKALRMQHEAATKIQALYRGYSVRLDMERERKIVSNLRPPVLSPRSRSGRKLTIEVDEVLMRNARAMILLHRKASELQATFKGYLTRKELKRRLVIKTHVNKKTPRKVVSSKSPSEEDKAAICIQKIFRGYSDRTSYERVIKEKRKIWHIASSKIQASLKGSKVRMDERVRRGRLYTEGLEEMIKIKIEAADIISYAYRGLASKKVRKAERYEM